MARILIADDHEGTRGILRVSLQDPPGWEIFGEASSNSEALLKSMELKPDILVKDWVMPGVSNLEITWEIARLLPATATSSSPSTTFLNFRPSPKLPAFMRWPPRIFRC
jgi:DNA-binding NarL/FixJ family response regulator